MSFYSLLGGWKIFSMTMTCNRCDVMNIMWGKTEMEQKSDRERWGDGGGGRGRGRVCWALEYRFMRKRKNKKRGRKNLFWIWPWKRKKEKEESVFQTSQGTNGKTGVPFNFWSVVRVASGKINFTALLCREFNLFLRTSLQERESPHGEIMGTESRCPLLRIYSSQAHQLRLKNTE